MQAPTVLECVALLDPVTRDDFLDEPHDDDRRAPTVPADSRPAHRAEPPPSRRVAA